MIYKQKSQFLHIQIFVNIFVEVALSSGYKKKPPAVPTIFFCRFHYCGPMYCALPNARINCGIGENSRERIKNPTPLPNDATIL